MGCRFREAGYPQEVDDIWAQIGKGGDLFVPTLLPDVDDSVRQRISDRHDEHFKNSYLDHVRTFDGATKLVRVVHASGRKVVLASSAKQAELDHYVELLGIGKYLAATTSIDDVEASKSEPNIFGKGLEKISVAPERALAVGDTIYDVEAARRAGVATVGLTSGPFDAAQMKDAGAVVVFAGVAELLREFDRSPLSD